MVHPVDLFSAAEWYMFAAWVRIKGANSVELDGGGDGQQLTSVGINQLLVLLFNGTQKENQTPDTSTVIN